MLGAALTLHLLAAVVWVGGMFFAYVVLRPVAAAQLDPPARLRLWSGAFARFFPWVWLAVILLPVTGLWLIKTAFGGMGTSPLYVHVMLGVGVLMILIYLRVFFAPYRRLKAAVAQEQWPAGGKELARIRKLVGLNLTLGLFVLIVVGAGRYFL